MLSQANMAKVTLLFFLLGVIGPGGGTLFFNGLPNTASVQENIPAGTRIYSFSVNASTTLSVSPQIVNSNPLTKAFQIDASPPTYYVVATGNPVLDFETMPNRFDLEIYIEDSTRATDLETLTVQLINVNEPPVFLDNLANQVVTVYIDEGTPVGVIYQVLASTLENTTLTYSLTPASAPFSISPSGAILSTKVFNYETDPHSYSQTIQVTDSAGLSVNGTLLVYIININDEVPYFTITNTSFSIAEEQNPGTVITTITAVDPDAAGTISILYYSIIPSNQYFSINEQTGAIQIAKRIDRDVNPFRFTPTIPLQIQVTDRRTGGQTNVTTITINIQDINDNPPVCPQYAFSEVVSETAPVGYLIKDLTTIGCSDIDVDPQNNAFNFSGLSGLGSSLQFQFTTSARIQLIGDLDFENPTNLGVGNEYSLSVVVQDIASPYYKKTIYIYVKTVPIDEYPPVFNSSVYVFNISEVSPPNSPVGQVYATDRDYPQTGITFTLVAGGSTLGASDIFWMDPTTGELLLATYADYETTPQYILTVQATSDSPPKTATATVTVNILEENDEPPVCVPKSYTLNIPVNQATGTNIQNFKLTCTDRDSGPTSFQYVINSGNENNHFSFSPTAGSNVSKLLLANPFDYINGADKSWSYNLRVYITDGNLLSTSPKPVGVVQTGTVSLFINVFIPGLTTTTTTTTPRMIYVSSTQNVYSVTAWYVPFVATIGGLLLLGLLGLLGYLLVKYCPCRGTPTPDTEMLIQPVEKKAKHDIVWEMTKMNTVFDGEAVDPITGNVYEYNSKSGARRWKDTKQPILASPAPQQPPVGAAEPTAPQPASSSTPIKKEKVPRQDEGKNAAKPTTPNQLKTPDQTPSNPAPENKVPPSRAPLTPRVSPKVSPKVPKTSPPIQ